MNYIVIIEKAEKLGHKAYTRVRRGKLERIGEKGVVRNLFEIGQPRRQKEESEERKAKSESAQIVDRMTEVMKVFKQSEGMCGPASIRIALSAFGKSMTEEQVAKLAKSSAEEGTTHKNIVSALKKSGVHAIEYHDLSKAHALEVLKNYTKAGKPVIVDWMKTRLGKEGDVGASEGMKPGVEEAKTKKDIHKEENEHYSVVNRVNDKNVFLYDPLEPKEEKLPIKYFMDRWFTVSEKAKRWFVVLEAK